MELSETSEAKILNTSVPFWLTRPSVTKEALVKCESAIL